ncbi:hypothetical protein AB0I81_01975 [Nonomuraea sp. NPDC050404]|uniref:hypothetical protein n=1 Tax=Nonomuraea sp. NPDC050404 TaxID=3155783 RepID=UPI0033E0FF6D
MIPTENAETGKPGTEWADAIDAGPAPAQLDGPQAPVPAMTAPTIDGGAAPRQVGDLAAGEIVYDTQVQDAGGAPEAPQDRDDSEVRT